MRQLFALLLLGASIFTIGPKGMEIGDYNPKTGDFMTIGPDGMKLGNIDPKTGSLFQLGKEGMTLGDVERRLGSKFDFSSPSQGSDFWEDD